MSSISNILYTRFSGDPLADRRTGGFDYSRWELLFMRLFFAILVFAAIKWEVKNLDLPEKGKLTGLSHIFQFAWVPKLHDTIGLWKGVTIAGLALYVCGVLPVLGLLPALVFSISIGTLANSQGAINHSTQLVSLILLGQFLVYAIPAHPLVRLSAKSWLHPDYMIHRRMAYVSLVVFAAGYVIAGYIKLHNSDWQWIQRVPNLALELQKSNWSEYYDTLQPVPPVLTTIVNLMNEHPNAARLVFGLGLVLELFAFLILLGRRWAFFYGLAIIVLHLSISRLMQLDFWYHMAAAMIFLVNLPGIRATFSRKTSL